MKFIDKYKSPNFDNRKTGTSINYIVLHYTAMKDYKEALNHLCDKNNKVSSHFLINKSGDIFYLVNIVNRAWHAGVSHWKGVDNLNDRSIGIELENPGHEFGYIPFSRKQMSSLVFLCKKIKNKYNIKADWVLGHSDISPGRKLDPGKKFNWNLIKKIFK